MLITFDIWLTLLKSNPDFKNARNEMLRDMLHPDVSFDSYNETLRGTDKMYDRLSEKSGVDYGFAPRVATASGISLDDPRLAVAEKAQDALCREFPPQLLHDSLPDLLSRLAETHTLAIVSNTGMIPGRVMRQLLDGLGLDCFDGYAFSNETNICKPYPGIFFAAKIAAGLPTNAPGIHIGDNPVADGGSTQTGLDFIHVTEQNPTHLILEGLLK